MVLNIEPFGHADLYEIKKLEEYFQVRLPDDYLDFLITTNGGRNTDYNFTNSVKIPHTSETVNIDVLFGVNTGLKNVDIDQWTQEYKEDLLEKTIIIGDTMQHGFIVFCLSDNGNQGIYYYDDSYVLESSSDLGNTYYLSSTFSEFLSIIAN